MRLFTTVREQYLDFAAYARDSPCFAHWAARVAADDELLAWIEALPPIKQQPNLVFAAARWHGVPAPGPYAALREALLGDDGALLSTILERSTQTNEVGRLATLAPVFARIADEADAAGRSRPLALLEVGPSAGLCLYPDRYAYRYAYRDNRHVSTTCWSPSSPQSREGGASPHEVELACRVDAAFTVPTRRLDIAWRGGVDVHPLEVTDDDAMAWLETLVWPEHEERRARLRAAIEIARSDPPTLRWGDLLTDTPDLVAQARAHGEVVVFHSAVLAYLEPDDRDRFVATMRDLVAAGACRWVSNEGRNVVPQVTASGPPLPAGHPTFALGLDGRWLAWTHGHGRSMRTCP